jgi:hypothetical protein
MTSALSFDYCLTGSYDTNVLLRNNAAVKMYVHTFKERGDAVLTYNQSESVQSDSTSIGLYGTRTINYDMKYEGDPTLPAPYSGVLLNRHKNPLTQVKTVKFCANSADQLMEYFMAIEPGSKIKLIESVSGVDADYFVNGISWDISGGKKLDATYYVKRADMEITGYQYYSQPGTSDGYDTFIYEADSSTNYGTLDYLLVTSAPSSNPTITRKALLKFDLTSIPGTASILNASLNLYLYNTPNVGGTANVFWITKNWVEDQATWNNYSTGNGWGAAGAAGTGDISGTALFAGTLPVNPGWISIDLNQVQGLFNQMLQTTSYGLLVTELDNSGVSAFTYNFRSSEYSDPSQRPYLVVNYLN